MTTTTFILRDDDIFNAGSKYKGESRLATTGIVERDFTCVAVLSIRQYGQGVTEEQKNIFEKEKQNLTYLNNLSERCTHIPRLYGFRKEGIFLEFAGTDNIEDLFQHGELIPGNDKCVAISRQVCQAVAFLHKNHLAHLAIHTNHILIDRENTVRLIDYKYLWKEGDAVKITTNGSFDFAPPEAWKAAANEQTAITNPPAGLAYKIDIYRLGLLLLRCTNPDMIPFYIHKNSTPPGWYDLRYVREQYQDMVEWYGARPPVQALGFLNLDPMSRITAEEALRIFAQLRELAPDPDPAFEEGVRKPGCGAFKKCSFGTLSLAEKKVTCVRLAVNTNAFSMELATSVMGIERYNLIKLRKLESPYFPTIFNIGASFYMEACDCDFGDILDFGKNTVTNQVYSNSEQAKLLLDIFRGVDVLHKNGYVHRDLKLENCLAHGTDGKLSDFGHTIRLGGADRMVSTATLFLAPPETVFAAFENRRMHPSDYPLEADDKWRLGILGLEFLRGDSAPLTHEGRIELNQKDLGANQGSVTDFFYALERFLENDTLEPNFKGLLRSNPKERISIDEAMKELQALQRA